MPDCHFVRIKIYAICLFLYVSFGITSVTAMPDKRESLFMKWIAIVERLSIWAEVLLETEAVNNVWKVCEGHKSACTCRDKAGWQKRDTRKHATRLFGWPEIIKIIHCYRFSEQHDVYIFIISVDLVLTCILRPMSAYYLQSNWKYFSKVNNN